MKKTRKWNSVLISSSTPLDERVEHQREVGHPVYSLETQLLLQLYETTAGVIRAFENGKINVAVALNPEVGAQISDSMGDSAQIITDVAHLPYGIMPQTSFTPGNMLAFRQVLSHMIDRRNLNETYAFGESEIVAHATFNSQEHPWYNEEVLTQIAGETADIDRARQILEEAGWDGMIMATSITRQTPRWKHGRRVKHLARRSSRALIK